MNKSGSPGHFLQLGGGGADLPLPHPAPSPQISPNPVFLRTRSPPRRGGHQAPGFWIKLTNVFNLKTITNDSD